MKKSKVNPELVRMYELWEWANFEDSRAAIDIDWVPHYIPAPRLYEIAKEKKVKKSKFYFNSMCMTQNLNGSIAWMVEHILRVERCDINIPIIVGFRWEVYDWLHRCIRAILEWKTWIWCYRLRIPETEWKKDETVKSLVKVG